MRVLDSHHVGDVSADKRDIQPIAVTIEAAKKLTGLGTTTIFKLIKDGDLQTVKVGRRTLVLVDSIERLLTPAG
jgi:excisionase family DNA binding protein